MMLNSTTSFLLEIITPERIAFSDQVEMVTAPSSSGQIGILPRHIPLFTRLVEGEVKILRKNEELYLAIGGGFLEVTRDKAIILVTEAFKASEINEKEILEARRKAEEVLKSKPSGEALISAQTLFRRSVIALKLLKRKRGSHSLPN